MQKLVHNLDTHLFKQMRLVSEILVTIQDLRHKWNEMKRNEKKKCGATEALIRNRTSVGRMSWLVSCEEHRQMGGH